MSDGATFHVPSAVRMVGKTLQLERDPANHPVYLVRTSHTNARLLAPSALLTGRAIGPFSAVPRAKVTRWA